MRLTTRALVGTVCLLVGSTVFAAAAGRSVVSVHDFDTLATIGGAESSLVRNPHGASMTLSTNGLEEGAYTNWFVIFNNPGACENPIAEIGAACGLDDLGLPAVNPSVKFATGNVVGPTGEGSFAASLAEGDASGTLFGPGLVDSRAAEIHIIVQYHGEVIPMHMPAQINTFHGGCPPNNCADVQAAAHSP